MILRSEIKFASLEVRARAKSFRAFERGSRVYVMTELGKDNRGVFFEGPKVECFSAEDGTQCPANTFGNVCCHSVAADRRKRINAKRRKTIAARKQQAQEAHAA
jgi:hypothetical protein